MKNTSLFSVMILFLLAFGTLAFLTGTNAFPYDETMIEWIDKVSSSTLLGMMEIISMIGSSEAVLLLTFLITVIFLLKKDWFHTIFFLTVSVGGVVLNFVLKFLFQRERPGEMSHIEVFNFSFDIPSYSFPSGHMMRITILILFLIYISYRFTKHIALKLLATIILVITLVGVALSRLFLDAHFLSDVLAAGSISVVWFCLCYFFFKRYEDKQKNNLFSRYRQWN